MSKNDIAYDMKNDEINKTVADLNSYAIISIF